MRRIAALMGVVALLLAVGVAVTSAAPETPGTKTARVDNDILSPSDLTIAKATKVKFNWVGNDKHNDVKVKRPGSAHSSPTTASHGVNLTHKYKKTGTYKIICTIH